MSSKNITGLKVGDLIIGNTGWTGSTNNSITSVINGASLIESLAIGSCYVAIKDEALVTLGGTSTSYTIIAIRQM